MVITAAHFYMSSFGTSEQLAAIVGWFLLSSGKVSRYATPFSVSDYSIL